MADELVVLVGGSRDGESTTVQEGVRRLLAVSEAPGLLDVYEADGTTRPVPGNPGEAVVLVHVGQQGAEDTEDVGAGKPTEGGGRAAGPGSGEVPEGSAAGQPPGPSTD